MSVMTIAVTAVQDLNGFVDASNSYGKQRVLDMGCKHTSIAKIVMGGEAAGLCGVSFEWESVDAAIAGSNAINSDGQMLQMMGDCGVSVVRRSVLEILAERGETRPTSGFGTAVYMSGNISAEGIDNGWRHMQEGANGLMISRAIANGMAPWTGLIMTFADSVDDLLSAAANAWADTAMQARNSMNDVKPLGRLINEIVA
jgi:hypothetical protein